MAEVDYVVRDATGNVQRGTFPKGDPTTIYVSYSKHISLNLNPSDVAAYQQSGNDLLITLSSGEVLILSGYFDASAGGEKGLFLSQNGEFVEVVLQDTVDGARFAGYDVVDVSGKWSAYDDLVFLDLGEIEQVVAPLAGPALSPLLGGLGLLGAGGAAVAGGGGGDDPEPIVPTVDDPDAVYEVGGTGPGGGTVSGTGEGGSTVVVCIGDMEKTITVADDGTWTVTFDPDEMPTDGVYESVVKVTNPGGDVFELDGPGFDIDTTAPDLSVTAGVQSTGDYVNAASHPGGATISGSGEAGATVEVTIDGTTHSTIVASDGSWSVTFATSEVSEGEYTTGITLVTTDARGNSASFSETLVVDTVAPLTDLNTVEGDDVVNHVEASDGVTLTGTGEAGASISVEFQGVTRKATVALDGTWSVDYAASEIAAGTYDATVTITATDAYGNSATGTHTVHVDTETHVSLDTPIAGDDVISGDEANSGVTLAGTAEAGASVSVTMAGVTMVTTADSSGNWTVTYGAGTIPGGEYDTTVTVEATDQAGNTASTSASARVGIQWRAMWRCRRCRLKSMISSMRPNALTV